MRADADPLHLGASNLTQMIPPNLTDLLSKAAGTPVPPHGWIWVLSNATPRAVVSTAEPAQKSGIVPDIDIATEISDAAIAEFSLAGNDIGPAVLK
ncbi:uncharacterized protein LOC115092844 isoform X4 [Rhinatrema bivittatum]|uniref:uncharacterized protein LOC115092844 isoform X4 n=1 Tax=Rhinatrema bivittatum TaxID=194408 RepID=UPI00112DB822|nr:uncharacterized protein LOC115092844 isoform X4 [Rhinatrema bivittatum]